MTRKKVKTFGKNNNKIILLSLVVLGLAAFGLNYHRSINVKTESVPAVTESAENFLVYTNNKYGYRFSYPATYELSGSDERIQLLSPRADEKPSNSEKELEIEVYVSENKNGYNLENFLADSTKNAEFTIKSRDKVILSGINAYHLTRNQFETYILIHNGIRVEIAKYPSKTIRQTEFEMIVKSLEFFDPSNPPNIQN